VGSEICGAPKPAPKLAEETQAPQAVASVEEVLAAISDELVLVDEPEGQSHPVIASVLAANGDTFELGVLRRSQTIASVKKLVAEKSGIAVHAQQLFVIDDNRQQDDLVLQAQEKIAQVMAYTTSLTELKLAVMMHAILPKWSTEFKGASIELSKEGRVATQSGSSCAIRGRNPILPNTGIHCFQYVYWHSDLKRDGDKLSVYLMVGVVQESVEVKLYDGDWTIGNSTGRWWGLASGGNVHEGAKNVTKTLAKSAMTSYEVLFGCGDRIGFAFDTDERTIQFYRNGSPIEGAKIADISADEPLYLVGCPRANAGAGTVLELVLPNFDTN
jgi:hypothetical protein